MRLSRAANYAFRALAYLVTQEPKRPIPSHVIAQAQGIPELFLLKVLNPLAAAGLLASVRGPNGGYRLARPARAVTMLEVIETIDGIVQGEAPLSREEKPSPLDRRLNTICQEATEKVRRHLAAIRLSDLLAKK
jgi:Rrf2 family protein